MKTTQILIAGFGGQGILFAGKFLAYKGMLENLQLSWLPSYGPEVLIAMNLPSLQKYVDTVVPGGQIYVDSALIAEKITRTDVRVFYIPATQMAKDNGISSLANMIIVGSLLQNHPELSFDGAEATVRKLVPPKKAALVDLNLKALQLGKEYPA